MGKTLMLKRKTEDESVGWHHWLNGHDFEQTPGDSEGQGSLACCSPYSCRVRHDFATEQQERQTHSLKYRFQNFQWWALKWWVRTRMLTSDMSSKRHIKKHFISPSWCLRPVLISKSHLALLNEVGQPPWCIKCEAATWQCQKHFGFNLHFLQVPQMRLQWEVAKRGGRWEGCSKGREYMYTYGWFMLRFDRKRQNSAKQLSFNKK